MAPRVLQLSTVHPIDDTRIMHRTAAPLAKAGYTVRLVGRPPAPDFDSPPLGVELRVLGPVPSTMAERLRESYRVLSANATSADVDIIQIHDPELVAAAALLRLRRWLGGSALPVLVFDAHEMLPQQIELKPRFRNSRRGRLLAAILNSAWPLIVDRAVDATIVAEDPIGNWMKRSKPIGLVRNTVDVTFFEKPDETPTDQWLRIVYVGATSHERGVATLIESIGLLDPDLDFHLSIVGGGILSEDALRQLAESCSQANATIEIHGRVSFDHAASIMQSSDIGVIPFHDVAKYRVSVPTKAWEYLAAGLAIVGSDLPPIRTIVAGRPMARLVEPGSAVALARAFEDTARLLPDRATRQARVRASLTAAEDFETDRARLLEMYQLLLPSEAEIGLPERTNDLLQVVPVE